MSNPAITVLNQIDALVGEHCATTGDRQSSLGALCYKESLVETAFIVMLHPEYPFDVSRTVSHLAAVHKRHMDRMRERQSVL